MKFYEHCKINCSGGCGDCAPDDHAFERWWKSPSGLQQGDDWEEEIAKQAFCAGFYRAVEYLKAINNEKAV